jgi:hypothetical protein
MDVPVLAATYVVMSISSQTPVDPGVKVATVGPSAGRLAYVRVSSDQLSSGTWLRLWIPPEPFVTNMRNFASVTSMPANVWRSNFK